MNRSKCIQTLAKVNNWDIVIVRGGVSELISILDGKCTTYRKMGDDAIDTSVSQGD
tara:strand:+ start:457 stop:624 length:168 start_codon:yes stop_codon:yes gene_type:complete